MDDFAQIKRLVIAHRVLFTEKAESEMAADGLTPELVYEGILNAPAIFKKVRSRNPRTGKREIALHHQGHDFRGNGYLYERQNHHQRKSGCILCPHLIKTQHRYLNRSHVPNVANLVWCGPLKRVD